MRQLWIVQRRGFDREMLGMMDVPRAPPRVPLCAFSEPHQAEAYRLELEQLARWTINPFTLGPLAVLSSLAEPELARRAPRGGPRFESLESDDPSRDWRRWWRGSVKGMTDEEIDQMWDLLDLVRLYEVVPLPLDSEAEQAGNEGTTI